MITFSVVSGKGGTGKTVFSSTLAHSLSERYLLSGSVEPNVLLVDMDMHVRGLSHLLYSDLVVLESAPTTVLSILTTPKDDLHVESIIGPISSDKIKISERISVLPSVRLNQTVQWNVVQKWSIDLIMSKLVFLIEAADIAGFHALIFDTRAAPDNIGLSAALSSQLTFIMLEQDQTSSEIALRLMGNLEFRRAEILQGRPDLASSGTVFIHNKRLDPYTNDMEKAFRDLRFLPAIALDLKFLREYYNSAKNYIIHGNQLSSKFGIQITNSLGEALILLKIPHTRISVEEPEQEKPRTEIRAIKWLRAIPPIFTLILGLISLSISSLQSLLPTLFSAGMSATLAIVGFFFIFLTLFLYWLMYNPNFGLISLPKDDLSKQGTEEISSEVLESGDAQSENAENDSAGW